MRRAAEFENRKLCATGYRLGAVAFAFWGSISIHEMRGREQVNGIRYARGISFITDLEG
jgi:hypothetical protein